MEHTLHELQTAIKKNEAVLFIGNEVARATTQGNELTNWKGLLQHGISYITKEIAGKYDRNWNHKMCSELATDDLDDVLAVSSKIERILQRYELFPAWLKTALGNLEVKNDAIIRAILRLHAPIITTNYDNLLEEVSGFTQVTLKDNVAFDSILKPSITTIHNQIIHIHGHVHEPNTIILGHEPYASIIQNENNREFLKVLTSVKSIIFIGVDEGIAAPSFESFKQWAHPIFQNSATKHYRLTRTSELEKCRELYKNYKNVALVPYGETHQDLLVFLKSLLPLKSLNSYLSTLNYTKNAWSDFFELIQDFVGRDKELEELRNFTIHKVSRYENIGWFSMYGSHGVGKSRLALEWLHELKESKWATGFIAYIPEQLEKILEYVPDKNTALVIDNVRSFDPYIWKFLDRVISRWTDRKVQLRILLISQTSLAGNTEDRVISETIKGLQYKGTLPNKAQKKTADQSITETKGKIQYISGLQIHPLSKTEDQRAIFDAAAKQNPIFTKESKIQELIKQCDGRPAFLALAGKFTTDWRLQLANYANEKLEYAASLFGEDGICIVTANALVGALSNAQRKDIAPSTDDRKKLSALFSTQIQDEQQMIPAIQPDLFAHELIYTAFSTYCSSRLLEMLHKVILCFPEAISERMTNMWREEINTYHKYSLATGLLEVITDTVSEASQKARVLELLFNAIASKMPPQSTRDTFNKFAQIRATAHAHILIAEENLSDANYRKVVASCFHEHMPFNGWSEYLKEIHLQNPITKASRLYWVSLIDYFIGVHELKDLTQRRAKEAKLTAYYGMGSTDETSLQKALSAHFESLSSLHKVYACFLVLNWYWNSKNGHLTNHQQIFDYLIALLKSDKNSEVLAASSALRTVIKETKDPQQKLAMQKYYGQKTIDALLQNMRNEIIFESLCATVGLMYETVYKDFEMLSWFEGVKEIFIKKFVYNSECLMPNAQIEHLIALFDSPYLTAVQLQNLAFLLLRIEAWHQDMPRFLKMVCLDDKIMEATKLQIVCRLAKTARPQATQLLLNIVLSDVNEFSEEMQLHALASLLYFKKEEALENLSNTKIHGLNISVLKEERARNSKKRIQNGTASDVLYGRILKLHISKRGHLIHKLKAKDTTGKWAYYFVYVPEDLEKEFMNAIGGDGTVDLEEYGPVIASCYGEKPTPEVKKYLKDRYGFNV